jgi:predicted ATPase
VVVVADRDAGADAAAAVREVAARQPPPPLLGLVYAVASPAEEPADLDLAVLDTVELLAWSQAALRIWLRTTLQGEPSPVLLDWLVSRSSGLPARAERELGRLTARNGLLRNESGAWTVAPALLARSTRNQRLPVPLTEFVGRQNETAQVAQLLADRRLVTLVGPGGIGKSRLALAVAAAISDGFDDGAVFVPLADINTPELVVAALAQALEVTEVPGQTLTATVFEQLADRATLLVIDNFEQVLDAAPFISELLAAGPRVRVLVSSRERLDLYGEQVYRVPPLPVPELDALRTTPEGVALALAGSPALALFNTRARAAAYDFAVTSDNITAVVELCHRLDGLPLAIELAAARCDELSPAEMLSQLGPQLDLSGPRDAPGRQRTLRGAIDWSFALLDSDDQDLFVRLGAFAGGCRADAVAALYPSDAVVDNVAKRLGGLADKSLVRAEPEDDDGVRYVLLETMRAYAVERMEEGPDGEAVRRRHAEHFAAFAQRAGRELTGARQARWAGRIEREYQNLRVAFGGSLGREPDPAETAPAARIVLGLWRFWRTGSHIGEGREWLDRVLAAELPDRPRAQVLHAAAVLAAAQDDHATAYRFAAESLERAREAGDAQTTAQASNALGIATLAAGDYPAARGFFTESLSIWQRQDQPFGMAIAHGNLTKVALRTGEIDAASEHAAQCLELERRQHNTRGIMLGLLCVGEIMLVRGEASGAREHLEEGLGLSRTLGDVFGEAMALHQLGLVARREGSLAEATRLVGAALSLRHEVGDREDLACSLDTLAGLLVEVDPEAAARLLGAADALRTRHRLPLPAEGQAEREATLARLRSTLDSQRFAAAWTTGQSVSLDLVVDEAVDRVAAVARGAA